MALFLVFNFFLAIIGVIFLFLMLFRVFRDQIWASKFMTYLVCVFIVQTFAMIFVAIGMEEQMEGNIIEQWGQRIVVAYGALSYFGFGVIPLMLIAAIVPYNLFRRRLAPTEYRGSHPPD